MASDGMLLNFEIGDALKPQVKFQGGRWRDRRRAKSIAKGRPNAGKKTWEGSNGTPLEKTRRIGGEEEDDDERPTKRQRIDGRKEGMESGIADGDGLSQQGKRKSVAYMTGKLPPGSIHTATKASGSGLKSGQVTSRLFTSNPLPKTSFEDQPHEEAEPAIPSNAPLAEGAENFLALGLSRRIGKHLSSKLEMKAPTSIQRNTIPQLIKEDSDAFLQAETGSGKTLAYLLPIVQRIMAISHRDDGTSTGTKVHRNSGLFAIILAPTRELCKQIATVLEKLLRCAPWIVSTTVIGGESKKSEKARIRKGVNILIATPGRLTDHLDHTEVLNVGTVRWLVLDEGDRLMEMGFEEELKSVVTKMRAQSLNKTSADGITLDQLPQRRVTVLCSATMKMNVQKLGEISLHEAIHVTASRSETEQDGEANEQVFAAPSQLKQTYVVAAAKLRFVTLIALLKSVFARKGSIMKAIIFVSCTHSADFHFELLRAITNSTSSEDSSSSKTATTVYTAAYITSPANPTISLMKLHGDLAQPVRTATLNAFKAEKLPAILLTTDISSRGLDVPAVDLVVEYDPAFAVADHLHRIGRTARAGRPGKAVLFLQPGCEEGYIEFLNTTMTGQPSDAVVKSAFLSPITLPRPSPGDPPPVLEADKSPFKRAEALQLHLEQRLLEPSNSRLLDAARSAFRSFCRAYKTHVREERKFFDFEQMHLGHVAKSFGLREAPGGIGMGVVAGKRKVGRGKTEGSGKKDGARGGDSEDEGDREEVERTRRMRVKMREVMKGAGEFNIG